MLNGKALRALGLRDEKKGRPGLTVFTTLTFRDGPEYEVLRDLDDVALSRALVPIWNAFYHTLSRGGVDALPLPEWRLDGKGRQSAFVPADREFRYQVPTAPIDADGVLPPAARGTRRKFAYVAVVHRGEKHGRVHLHAVMYFPQRTVNLWRALWVAWPHGKVEVTLVQDRFDAARYVCDYINPSNGRSGILRVSKGLREILKNATDLFMAEIDAEWRAKRRPSSLRKVDDEALAARRAAELLEIPADFDFATVLPGLRPRPPTGEVTWSDYSAAAPLPLLANED